MKSIFGTMSLSHGQKIEVSCKNGSILMGTFDKLSCQGSRLDIDDPTDEKGSKLGRFRYLFQDDVIEVNVLSSIVPPLSTSPSSIHSDTLKEELSSTKPSSKQLENIQKTIDEYVYISQVNMNYFDAIANISKQFVIAISAEGCDKGRIFDLDVISIATLDKIYIFDVLQLNGLQSIRELQNILEDQAYLKVVYDARLLSDNMNHRYKIKLNPVFDLHLFSAQLNQNKKPMTLTNCVKTILGISSSINEVTNSVNRPMPKEKLRLIAEKSAYHLAMYHQLIQVKFLKKLHTLGSKILPDDFAELFHELTTSKTTTGAVRH